MKFFIITFTFMKRKKSNAPICSGPFGVPWSRGTELSYFLHAHKGKWIRTVAFWNDFFDVCSTLLGNVIWREVQTMQIRKQETEDDVINQAATHQEKEAYYLTEGPSSFWSILHMDTWIYLQLYFTTLCTVSKPLEMRLNRKQQSCVSGTYLRAGATMVRQTCYIGWIKMKIL